MNVLLDIIQVLLSLLWWIIVIQAILSWLIAFNVINTYNDFVRSVWHALGVITEPIYRPIRRILPDTGPMDFAPFVVLILIAIVNYAVIPNLAVALASPSV